MVTCSWCVEKSLWHYSKTPPCHKAAKELLSSNLFSRAWLISESGLTTNFSDCHRQPHEVTESRSPGWSCFYIISPYFSFFELPDRNMQLSVSAFDSEDFNYIYVTIGLDQRSSSRVWIWRFSSVKISQVGCWCGLILFSGSHVCLRIWAGVINAT